MNIGKNDEYILTFKDITDLKNVNIYPGWSASKVFEITNTSAVTLTYNINFTSVKNEFSTTNNLYYGLIKDNKTLIDINTARAPYKDGVMLKSIIIKPGETHTYMFKLMFKDSDVNQDIDKGKIFIQRYK